LNAKAQRREDAKNKRSPSWNAAASGARRRFQTVSCKSGISPVPRQPPQSKTLARRLESAENT